MQLRFDPTFDRGAWPDALADESAVAGKAAVGRAGLLGLLETVFGLTGVWAADVERAATLIPALLGSDGFWRESAAADPLGTARRLLRLRDDLWLEGWSGERLSGRLERLAALTADVPAGFADRVAGVSAALSGPGAGRAAEAISRLEVLAPSDDLPGRWRRLLDQLAAAGVDVVPTEVRFGAAGTMAGSDLAEAKAGVTATPRTSWMPRGDATLQLIRPIGVVEAAEATAAWLAATSAGGGLEGIVLVGGDTVLDAACARYGLPTGGARPDGRDTPLAGALPLVVQLAWGPPEPAYVRSLLLLPHGPIPRAVAAGLVRALDEWPAVGSPDWGAALDRAVDGRADAALIRRTVDVLFVATVKHGERCAPAALEARLAALEAWCGAGLAGVAAAETASGWRQVARQLELFRRLAATAVHGAAEASGWLRLASAATEAAASEAGPEPRHPAQAGLARVGDPGGMSGPARAVVWWDFTEDAEPGSAEPPVSAVERRDLAAAGVHVPDFARRAMSRAARYRRPLLAATESLLLVAPRRTEAGEDAHPHPLWDEISAGMDAAALDAVVAEVPRMWRGSAQPPPMPGADGPWAGAAVSLPRAARPLTAAPAARRDWLIPAATVALRHRESPSSLEALLGCPLNWVLKYVVGARGGLAAGSYGLPILRGKVAHAAVGEALTAGVPPAEAAAVAEAYFERMGPTLAAGLFVPGAEADRASLRHLVGAAARDLAETLLQSGYFEVEAERTFEASGPTSVLGGRADLVLGPRRAVIDMKLGGARRLKRALEAGTAMQLAAYSDLVAQTSGVELDEAPPVGYYVLADRRMLTTTQGAFHGSTVVAGPSMEATWAAAGRAVAERLAQLADGAVEASGVGGADLVPSKSSLEDGELVVEPPCRYCDFGALCGRSFGLAVAP